MKKPWHKIATKTEWDKACASACVAARVEVPQALLDARRTQQAQKKRQAVKNTLRGMEGQ